MSPIKVSFLRSAVLIITAVCFASNVASQSVTKAKPLAKVVDYKLESKLMGRQMPYRVILPVRYAQRVNQKYPVIYLLHGLFGHYDNWTTKTGIQEYAAEYPFIVVMPEGDDGWYTDSPVKVRDKYESYIIQELIPEIEKRFRAASDRDHRIVAGLSMGGYGAVKFGLRYPDRFSLVGSFSGALGAATYLDKIPASIGKTIDVIFGPADSETRRANDIFRMVHEIPDSKAGKNLPFIYQSCGLDDLFFPNNREFADLLIQKHISHEFRQLPGNHNWTFWDSQIREFLAVADRHYSHPL